MCSISGYIDFTKNYIHSAPQEAATARKMALSLRQRGPDDMGIWVGEHAVFAHTRLAVIDPDGGKQPMKRTVQGYDFIICYNGELYNAQELRRDLEGFGYEFSSSSDTEVLLYAYIHYGKSCAERLNGIFAFAIYDVMRQRVFLCRDRFGVKPLFYSVKGTTLIFASEIKALFEYPDLTPRLDRDGLCELFGMSPARSRGSGVYKDIYEVPPAGYMTVGRQGILSASYFTLKSKPHTDSYAETIANVQALVTDAVKRQLVSDVPLATFLSGGLDSSVITAIAARELKERGETLSTYSFDYEGNNEYFTPSAFQPDSDASWVGRVSEECATEHTKLVCPTAALTEHLADAVLAKDLPGMADCDSSLWWFCREVKKRHTVVLSGECSDELFGGYPWFRSEAAFNTEGFPWNYDMSMRNYVLKDAVAKTLDLDGYVRERYREAVSRTPRYEYDTPQEARRREIAWLNIEQFMTNLLDRKDRMSMASGLEVRVPFCDHRLAEYVWNIPWSMKNKDNVSKNVLREAAKGLLSEEVRLRKKSPYPKTHNPLYERKVKAMLKAVIADDNSPLLAFCEKGRLMDLVEGNGDYGKPFFGQLMAYPQFLGYLVQLDLLLRRFEVRIV